MYSHKFKKEIECNCIHHIITSIILGKKCEVEFGRNWNENIIKMKLYTFDDILYGFVLYTDIRKLAKIKVDLETNCSLQIIKLLKRSY